MAESIIGNRTRDFWSEVKRRSGGKTQPPNAIDNAQGDEEICYMFPSKYDELYNSVPYDHREMNDVMQEIDDLIDTKCNRGQCYYDHMVRARDVLKAMRAMKPGKSGVNGVISSDRLIYAPEELAIPDISVQCNDIS
ncbi:hypothetical protein CAPTEDRAFT_201654 [Capitella teleta]|uniref:Uncharacterized protein n=1 Tax=Capitella teleta TaxID=283909 RepID=R7UD13_CAPTE|nr:hypothetical protein CAPTEDRAFT_201654 [Capitella teleta]|eukprot:ELU03966.1 hypothetical protein CAPTEDRAFT_201654 [Capitella teleta]